MKGDTLSSVRASVLWLHKESRKRGDFLRDSNFAEGPFLNEASKLQSAEEAGHDGSQGRYRSFIAHFDRKKRA